MRKYICLITLITTISCQEGQVEKETTDTLSIQSKYSRGTDYQSNWWNSGFFAKENKDFYGKSTVFLNICQYDGMMSVKHGLSKKELDSLMTRFNIHYLYYKLYPRKSWYKTYYEIMNTSGWKSTKVAGKLYWLGAGVSPYAGGVFISDTTEQYGWFMVLLPVTTEYSNSYQSYPDSVVKYTRIKSNHPKAQELCGNYERLSWNPYRLIRDEEVAKEEKTK